MRRGKYLIVLTILLSAIFFYISFLPPGNLYAEDGDLTIEQASKIYPEIKSLLMEKEMKKAGELAAALPKTERIIIKYKAFSKALKVFKNNRGLLLRKEDLLIDRNIISVKVPDNMTFDEAIDYFKKRIDIEFVEEDFIG